MMIVAFCSLIRREASTMKCSGFRLNCPKIAASMPLKISATVLRLREHASQAVFARHLNVTTGLVSQWERGEKHPQGASLKLLALVAKNGLHAIA